MNADEILKNNPDIKFSNGKYNKKKDSDFKLLSDLETFSNDLKRISNNFKKIPRKRKMDFILNVVEPICEALCELSYANSIKVNNNISAYRRLNHDDKMLYNINKAETNIQNLPRQYCQKIPDEYLSKKWFIKITDNIQYIEKKAESYYKSEEKRYLKYIE